MKGAISPPLLFQRPGTAHGPAANPDKRLTMTPSSGRPQTNRSVFITPRGFYLCGRSVMIDKGERFMHITTHHISAKGRHIDAVTRLRRLSHVVATSTRVVRGCKLPPPVNEKKHSELFYNCARIGSFRSASAACYMRTPRPHGCGAWICTRLREHPRGEAPLGLYRICFNSAPTPRRPSVRFCPHAESRRPAFSVWAVDSSCPYPSSFGSVCSVPANAPKGKMELAELLQTPQRGKWSLQNFCKRPKGENGACRTSANACLFIVI